MGINVDKGADGIATVTVDYPPVNAIPSAGWFELGEQILAAGRDPEVHVVILRAEGRGFNAGVDIKEMQDFEGFDHLRQNSIVGDILNRVDKRLSDRG